MFLSDGLTETIRESLEVLGIQRLVLAVHDQSFPSTPDEDIGRGSPYSRGARALLDFIRGLGFGGLQFGPQGDTSLADPSPYGGALFTKSPLSIALGTLERDPSWAPLVVDLLAPIVADRPVAPADRASYTYAWRRARQALDTLYARFCEQRAAGRPNAVALERRLLAFRQRRQSDLGPDGDFEALYAEHGHDDWRQWPGPAAAAVDQLLWCPPPALADAAARRRAQLRQTRGFEIDRHTFGQFVLDEQHRALRADAAGLALYGDLQIGYSHRDVWARRALFRTDYLMGAPPSRTNPAGQAWGYPVPDPNQFTVTAADGHPRPGPVLALLCTRLDRVLEDFDGVRIDHPHGLVCPWVYAAGDPEPDVAVGRGARLFCSPNLPDHPTLAAFAIPTPEQLSRDPGISRYADDWVQALRPEQIDRYGRLFDAVMARVAAAGRDPADVVCEVLSTWPFPLRAVMARYGLGRFCVTQKGDLGRADDVYRSENASPQDWIMVGNHDTRPIWALTQTWHGTAPGNERASYLATRLTPIPSLRPRLARWLASDSRHLAQGMFAELFASRARRVSVFFADLFGMSAVYNRPGVVDPENWTLRIPSDFQDRYLDDVGKTAAFNVPLALALALAARGTPETRARSATLVRRLLDGARELAPALDPEILAIVEANLRGETSL